MSVASIARRAVKIAALPASVGRPRAATDTVVLLYHRIADGGSEIDLPAPVFERHLRLLGAGRVRTLAAVLERPGGVVVTFDDGTPDFAEAALPALERHLVPAVLYLTTGWIGTRGLSWSQLDDVEASGLVEVGSHTHDHVDLSRADARTAEEQMRRSKEVLEDRLGRSCDHFAYPFAVGSPAADAVARRLFRSAALDAWRTNRGAFDPYRIGRTPVLRSDGVAFFRAKVGGRLDAERVAYRLAGRGPWRS